MSNEVQVQFVGTSDTGDDLFLLADLGETRLDHLMIATVYNSEVKEWLHMQMSEQPCIVELVQSTDDMLILQKTVSPHYRWGMVVELR